MRLKSAARASLVIVVLALLGILGLGVERSLAYTVGTVSTSPSSRTVVYGNWDLTEFSLSAPVSGGSAAVSWSVTGLPNGSTGRFSLESISGSTASATLIIEQTVGTSGPDVGDYTLTVTATSTTTASTNVTLSVAQRPVKIAGSFDVSARPYDGGTTATISTNSLALESYVIGQPNEDRGFISRDSLSLVPVATFASKDAGTRSVDLLASTLGGADATNYRLDFTDAPTATGVVQPKGVTISGLTFSKVYNGTTAITATGSPAVASGVIEGEVAPTISGSPTWVLDDPNVGTNKTVNISSGSYTSSNPNYTVSTTSFATATVAKATLTVNFSATSRPYNGSTDVTSAISAFTYSGLAARDSAVTASFTSATAASKDVGTRAVTLNGLTLSTQEARDNYTVQAQAGLNIVISAKALTLEGSFSATSRPYDGTRAAAGDVSGLTLVGVVGSENVTLGSVVLQFDTANQAVGKPVSVASFSLGGTASGNYTASVSGAPTATATITPFVLTITPTPAAKTYDGSRTASVSCTTNTFADGLNVGVLCQSAQFDGDGRVVLVGGVAQAQAITVGTVTLTNNALGNYALPEGAVTTQRVISPKTLTISGLSGVGRVYDGSTTVSVAGTPSLVGVESSDDVALTGTAVFALNNKNVGVNKAITVTGFELAGADATNYTLTQPTGLTATISTPSVTVTIDHSDGGKTYDATTRASSGNVTLTVVGAVPDDTVSATFESASFDSKNAGTRTLTVTGIDLTGTDAGNYSTADTASNNSVEIRKKALTIGAPRMEYSGSASGTATFQRTGVVTVCDDPAPPCRTDAITFTVSGSFDQEFVHIGQFSWSAAISVQGADKDNYEYTLPNSPVADDGRIYARDLGVGGLTAASGKDYDGSTSAAGVVTGTPVLTRLDEATGTKPSLAGAAMFSFDSAFVGEDITIRTAGLSLSSIGGCATQADVDCDGTAEFILYQPSWQRDISTRTLTITGTFEADDRDYNRAVEASIKTNSLGLTEIQQRANVLDTVSLATVAVAFADASAAAGKTASIVSATLSGADQNNDGAPEYDVTVVGAPTATAEIRKVNLDSTLQVTVSNKPYDGTTDATITGATVMPLTGDTVTVAAGRTAVFVSRNQGSNKTVDLSNLSLEGAHAGNYSLSSTRSNFATTASISRATLTVTGITSPGKVYDRTNAAPKRLDGGDACVKDQGATCVVDDLSATLSGVKSPGGNRDAVELVKSGGIFSFNNVNQGSRTLNGSSYTLSGADSGNYTLTQPSLNSTPIDRKPLTAGASATTRAYNGTANAASITTLSLPGVIAGDTVSVAATAITFDGAAGRDVGSGKAITASGLSLSGASSGNYVLTSTTAMTTGAITAFTLTLSPSATDKVYDGNDSATASCSINRFVVSGTADDVSAVCTSATFPSKNVVRNASGLAISQTVTITAITLGGTAAGNYILSTTAATTSARITPQPLVATGFTPQDKYYDGERPASFDITGATLSGFVGSDSFTLSAVGGLFATSDVVYEDGVVAQQNVRLNSWTFTGADSAITNNYDIDIDNSPSRAKILPKPLNVTVTTTSKVYNGTPAATLVASFINTDLIARDRTTPASVTASATGVFVDENVANGKTVTIQTATLAGSRAFNYAIQASATTVGNITPRTLTWTVVASSKEYDGSAEATVTLNDNRIAADVFTKTFSSAVFANANVGTSKTVTVSGISISGADAGNYVYATSRTGVANITSRQITVTGTFTAEPKTYDRSRTAVVDSTSGLLLGNVVEADRGNLAIQSTTATFDNANAGTDKTVTLAGLVLSGGPSGNYTIDVSGVTPYTLGIINARILTPTITIQDRLWDGTTTATILTATVSPLAGDTVSVNLGGAAAAFQNASQGDAKRVDVSGLALQGIHAGNYSLAPTAIASASITGTPLTISINAEDKIYDGTRAATFTFNALSLSDPSHVVTVAYTSALFDQSAWGSNITVTVAGIRLEGADANRYMLTSTSATDTANISRKTLTVEANDKVYDANAVATVSLSGVATGESIVLTFSSATFDNENVGTNKSVTLADPALSGLTSSNYSLPSPLDLRADITPRPLTVAFTPNPTVSNPASPVSVDPEDDRIAGDTITLQYTDASAIRRGNQLVLVVTGITLSGLDANNYVVTTPFERVLRTYSGDGGGSSAQSPAIAQPTSTDPPPRRLPPSRITPLTPPNSRTTTVSPAPTPTPAATVAQTAPSLPGLRSLNAPPGNGGGLSQNLGSPFSGQATIDLGIPAQTNATSSQNSEEPAVSSNSAGRRTVDELAQENLRGFQPGVTTYIEILGARTAARFVVSDTTQVDQLTLIRAIEASVPTQSANFFAIESVQPVNQPIVPVAWTTEERAGVTEFFAGAGLPEPSTLADLNLDDYSQWLLVTANSSTYAPGTQVYLTLTSEPLVLASAVVGRDGTANLSGTLPVEFLTAGEHRVRLAGIRALDGVSVDDEGSVQISPELLEEIERFDLGTQATIAVIGPNTQGANHVALRVIPLIPVAPWWTLWLILVGALIALAVRFVPVQTTRVRRITNVVIGAVALVPAVILGWLSTVTAVMWWGLGLGLAAMALSVLGPYQKAHKDRPAGSRRY